MTVGASKPLLPSGSAVGTTPRVCIFCRDHTLQTLNGVYAARAELNLEAIRLMVPQVISI